MFYVLQLPPYGIHVPLYLWIPLCYTNVTTKNVIYAAAAVTITTIV